jgi:diamine N-acetyltransferase
VGRTIRRAGVADAAALSDIGIRSFMESFGHLYGPEDAQDFLDAQHSPQAWTRMLADPACATWLLEDDGLAVGYALAGPVGLPHEDARSGDGELKRLYVLRDAQNGGWGGKLFDVALKWLERDGARTLWISVWSENLGAQRFYARSGFEQVGEYRFVVGKQRDREFIFRRGARNA